MNRDYDEYFENFDDTSCYHCGKKFPADLEIEKGTVEWEGFCSVECLAKDDLANQARMDAARGIC